MAYCPKLEKQRMKMLTGTVRESYPEFLSGDQFKND
jgi:hypothetical protein